MHKQPCGLTVCPRPAGGQGGAPAGGQGGAPAGGQGGAPADLIFSGSWPEQPTWSGDGTQIAVVDDLEDEWADDEVATAEDEDEEEDWEDLDEEEDDDDDDDEDDDSFRPAPRSRRKV